MNWIKCYMLWFTRMWIWLYEYVKYEIIQVWQYDIYDS